MRGEKKGGEGEERCPKIIHLAGEKRWIRCEMNCH